MGQKPNQKKKKKEIRKSSVRKWKSQGHQRAAVPHDGLVLESRNAEAAANRVQPRKCAGARDLIDPAPVTAAMIHQ
jgi:hypothetical protein